MNSIHISKIRKLKGTVKVSGSKNASLPILCASLLHKKVTLYNVPNILDIDRLLTILEYLGSKITWKKKALIIDNTDITYKSLVIEECSLIRGSYYLIPVMLKLFKKCEILLPGGCQIGQRAIDAHIDMIKAFGFIIKDEGNKLIIKQATQPTKINYTMTKKSVGASMNAMMMALISEHAVIDNIVVEPEGLALIEFLHDLGYNISVFNNKCVYKKGQSFANSIKYKIIPDRIEAITFIIMGLLCGNIKVKGLNPNHMKYPLDLLKNNGYNIKINKNSVISKKSKGSSFDITTKEYPFFPTDMQPLFGVLLAYSKGSSTIIENIFDNRMHIYSDLTSIGFQVNIINNKAYLIGGKEEITKEFTAYDLRHGAALLILILKIGGRINNVKIIERGYEDIYKKIKKLGGKFILS